MGLVTETVARLLRRRPVIAQAVGFNDQPQVRPVEVDLEAVHAGAGEWRRKARGLGDGEKPLLELGISEKESPAVK